MNKQPESWLQHSPETESESPFSETTISESNARFVDRKIVEGEIVDESNTTHDMNKHSSHSNQETFTSDEAILDADIVQTTAENNKPLQPVQTKKKIGISLLRLREMKPNLTLLQKEMCIHSIYKK